MGPALCALCSESTSNRPHNRNHYFDGRHPFKSTKTQLHSSQSSATTAYALPLCLHHPTSTLDNGHEQPSSGPLQLRLRVRWGCVEKSNDGGDLGFIIDIMRDSQFFRHHVTWYTSLVAKRSSLDAVLHQLQMLDGIWGNRGQIRTVEFRQGSSHSHQDSHDDPMRCSPRVRWGIAWTYERADARCDACRIRNGLTSFTVSLDDNDIASDGQCIATDTDAGKSQDVSTSCCNEVASRMTAYFESFGGESLSLKRTTQTRNSLQYVTVTEERFANQQSIPSPKHEDDNLNLPPDGHFIIDAFVKMTRNNIDDKNNLQYTVEVCLEMYSHTRRGSLIVDKIRGPMPGEIGRTNRRWRRLQKNTCTKK